MKKNDLSNVSEVKKEGALSAKSILFSLLISFGITLVLFLILALIVTYTSFKEENVNLARKYWNNKRNIYNKAPIIETLVNGRIKVIEILNKLCYYLNSQYQNYCYYK